MFWVSSSMLSCMAVYDHHLDPICLTKTSMWLDSPMCLEPIPFYEWDFLPYKA